MSESLMEYLSRIEVRCKQLNQELSQASQQADPEPVYLQVLAQCRSLLEAHERYEHKNMAQPAFALITGLRIRVLQKLTQYLITKRAWSKAEEYARAWSEAKPDDPEASSALHQVSAEIERIDQERASRQASQGKCETAYANGEFEQCIELSKVHLEHWPDDDVIRGVRLTAYLAQVRTLLEGSPSQPQKAFESIRECQHLYPQSPIVIERKLDVWLSWARHLQEQHRYDEAFQRIEECLIEYPDNAKALKIRQRIVAIQRRRRTLVISLASVGVVALCILGFLWSRQESTVRALGELGILPTFTPTVTSTPTATNTPTPTPTLTPTPTSTSTPTSTPTPTATPTPITPTATPVVGAWVGTQQWLYTGPSLTERTNTFVQQNSPVTVLCIQGEAAKIYYVEGSLSTVGWMRASQLRYPPNYNLPGWISETADCP